MLSMGHTEPYEFLFGMSGFSRGQASSKMKLPIRLGSPSFNLFLLCILACFLIFFVKNRSKDKHAIKRELHKISVFKVVLKIIPPVNT